MSRPCVVSLRLQRHHVVQKCLNAGLGDEACLCVPICVCRTPLQQQLRRPALLQQTPAAPSSRSKAGYSCMQQGHEPFSAAAAGCAGSIYLLSSGSWSCAGWGRVTTRPGVTGRPGALVESIPLHSVVAHVTLPHVMRRNTHSCYMYTPVALQHHEAPPASQACAAGKSQAQRTHSSSSSRREPQWCSRQQQLDLPSHPTPTW